MLQRVQQYLKNTDWWLLLLALFCSAYGCALIYSATRSTGSVQQLMVQIAATVIGLVAFVFMSLVDLENMSNWWKFFLIGNILLQCMLIPFGLEINGQRNWISLGPIGNMQPGELGKLLFVFTFSAHLAELKDSLSDIRSIVRLLAHVGVLMIVIELTSGDTGMAIAYLMIALVMAFAAGVSLKWFGAGAILGVISVPILWNFVLKEYQKTRILVLFDPSINAAMAYQTSQSKTAIGSGLFSGQGLLEGSMTQMSLIPEKHTDMIFAVAGEELGFLGCMLIVLLLGVLIARLFYIGYTASTSFSTMLAIGIAGMFLFQTFMNIFMCIGILPVMGLTLPFFSYGGTSVVTMYAALGIAAGVRMRAKPSWLSS